MKNQQLIIDKGLLSEQRNSDYSLENTYEEIRNLLKVIKEYRDYSNPDSESWSDYIHDFFSMFQFSLVKVTSKLYKLLKQGSTSVPSAVLAIFSADTAIHPTPGDIEWEPYLFYAAKYYGTRWGIIFNGLELKVIDCSDERFSDKYVWANVDGIIINERDDSFFSIYKLFSLIREEKEIRRKIVSRRKKQTGKKYKGRFPQSGYRMPILKVLIELNGKGKVKEILARVYEILKDQLRDVDLRLITGGQYSWQNTAQWERLVMKKDGLLESDSPRGIWEISSLGRQYYHDHKMDNDHYISG